MFVSELFSYISSYYGCLGTNILFYNINQNIQENIIDLIFLLSMTQNIVMAYYIFY